MRDERVRVLLKNLEGEANSQLESSGKHFLFFPTPQPLTNNDAVGEISHGIAEILSEEVGKAPIHQVLTDFNPLENLGYRSGAVFGAFVNNNGLHLSQMYRLPYGDLTVVHQLLAEWSHSCMGVGKRFSSHFDYPERTAVITAVEDERGRYFEGMFSGNLIKGRYRAICRYVSGEEFEQIVGVNSDKFIIKDGQPAINPYPIEKDGLSTAEIKTRQRMRNHNMHQLGLLLREGIPFSVIGYGSLADKEPQGSWPMVHRANPPAWYAYDWTFCRKPEIVRAPLDVRVYHQAELEKVVKSLAA